MLTLIGEVLGIVATVGGLLIATHRWFKRLSEGLDDAREAASFVKEITAKELTHNGGSSMKDLARDASLNAQKAREEAAAARSELRHVETALTAHIQQALAAQAVWSEYMKEHTGDTPVPIIRDLPIV